MNLIKRQINPIIVNPLKKPNLFLIDFKIQTKYLKKKANQCHIVAKKISTISARDIEKKIHLNIVLLGITQ